MGKQHMSGGFPVLKRVVAAVLSKRSLRLTAWRSSGSSLMQTASYANGAVNGQQAGIL